MKTLIQILVVAVLILASMEVNFAQGEKAPSPIRPQHIDLPKETISIKYEKAKDETVVQMNPMLVSEDEYFASAYLLTVHNLIMQGYFTYPGKAPKAPSSVYITFLSLKHAERFYQKDRHLSFIVDGSRLEIGEAQLIQFQAMGDNVLKEVLAIEIPYEKFMSLVNAKKVKMILGPTEWELKKNHLKAFHDFASRMQPSGSYYLQTDETLTGEV
jgi:hypothetical protein